MQIENVKLGQKVVISDNNLFYSYNIGKTATVSDIDGMYVTVVFEGGDTDYGYAAGLRLIEPLQHPVQNSATIKEAIADVETALAALKALVG